MRAARSLSREVYAPRQRSLWGVLLCASLLWACTSDELDVGGANSTQPPGAEDFDEFTLTTIMPADAPDSCVSCHPRQFQEWLGSSHNYGSGLDGTYQSLELTANYYAAHVTGAPIFRQSQLCITCHAPTLAAFDNDPQSPTFGLIEPNDTLREQYAPNFELKREVQRPPNGVDLLPPAGVVIEGQTDPGATPEEMQRRRQISFQGITCDACHKVSGPHVDREDIEACNPGEDPKLCAARQLAVCASDDDPRCRRRTRQQQASGAPIFEDGIANFAIDLEREGSTRFGPFPAGDAVPNTAHDVSSGRDASVQEYNVATYPDRTPFPDQDPDLRPYLKSSQFCGSCHDVRLAVDDVTTAPVEMEPVHNEPFLRLENLYTEWHISPLNLHPTQRGTSGDPRLQWRDNPYRNEDGSARRVVCQDCHMSLYPYAPPGTFPGAYTHGEMCDDGGECGLTIATKGARANLRIPRRERVTTHNMTGVDIGLGFLKPKDPLLANTTALALPYQTARPDLAGAPFALPREALDPTYAVPATVDTRRVDQLKQATTVSLAGTPSRIDRSSPAGCEATGTCCDEEGVCTLPVKAWAMNINGGHNIAAGFSQERQIWLEVTVQDMGRLDSTGQGRLVDCELVPEISELYQREVAGPDGYPVRTPRSHTVDSANDLFNRLAGVEPGTGELKHELICRGLSGHLIDKPHDETHEAVADGLLDDEDILLHRIGNTLPEFEDGREAISWHVLDLGFPLQGDPADPLLGNPSSQVEPARVTRPDQFHVLGQDAFACELGATKLNPALGSMPVVLRDGTTAPLSELGDLKYGVVATPDERLELLYPFPEYEDLSPHRNSDGSWFHGDRLGLAYLTNIFYRVCGCERGQCVGPQQLTMGGKTYEAQVPWLTTYPTLPHTATINYNDPDHDKYHLPVENKYYSDVLQALGMPGGSPYAEAFTFVPLNANHMPNNRSLKMYQPQRHYWDIRVGPEVVGPIRVSVKMWYRHFPPEFLRIMARSMEAMYKRAELEGNAAAWFPNGPLVVEGEMAERFPLAPDIDHVRRVLLDEAVTFVDVGPARQAPASPTFAEHIKPILQNHCLPCHSDVLQQGNLILAYDAYNAWDYPPGKDTNPARDPRANLVNVQSGWANGRTLVVPGNPDASLLMDLLTRSDEELQAQGVFSRRMPLKFDRLSQLELDTVRNWIAAGAP